MPLLLNNFDKLLADLKGAYAQNVQCIERLQHKLDSWNKDEEIRKYRDEAEDARRHSLISMSDKEMEANKAFRKKHYESCAKPMHSKAVGNTYIYEITGTGIGTIIKITCPLCGESEDITDTDSW